MTVAELIEKLREMPQDAIVAVPAMLGSYYDNIERTVNADRVSLETGKYVSTADGDYWVTKSEFRYADEVDIEPREFVEIR